MRLQRKQFVSAAVSRTLLFRASVLATLISLSIACAHAEAPKQLGAFGLKLGQSPALVQLLIMHLSPQCAIELSVYHESEGYPEKVTALFDVGLGRFNICRYGPPEHQMQQTVSLAFAHPSIAADQPLYQINWHREFSEIGHVPDSKTGYPFDKARTELFRTYGRPADVREEKIGPSSAGLAKSSGAGASTQREAKLVRYLWAPTGSLPEDVRSTVCDCGAQYVMATLEISTSPASVPKNKYFVVSLTIFVRDSVTGARQDEWNAQWQKVK